MLWAGADPHVSCDKGKAQIERKGVVNPKTTGSSETVNPSLLYTQLTFHCLSSSSHPLLPALLPLSQTWGFCCSKLTSFPPPFDISATQQMAELGQDLILWITFPANPLSLLRLWCDFSPAQACVDTKPQNALPPSGLQMQLPTQSCFCNRPCPAPCVQDFPHLAFILQLLCPSPQTLGIVDNPLSILMGTSASCCSMQWFFYFRYFLSGHLPDYSLLITSSLFVQVFLVILSLIPVFVNFFSADFQCVLIWQPSLHIEIQFPYPELSISVYKCIYSTKFLAGAQAWPPADRECPEERETIFALLNFASMLLHPRGKKGYVKIPHGLVESPLLLLSSVAIPVLFPI